VGAGVFHMAAVVRSVDGGREAVKHASTVVALVFVVPSLIALIAIGGYIEYIWWFQHPEYTSRVMFLEHWKLYAAACCFAIPLMIGMGRLFR